MELAKWAWIGAVLCAGCAGPPATAAPDDALPAPLAGEERPLVVEIVPGEPPADWPAAIVEGRGRFLLPWRDGTGLHARVVGDGEPRDFALGAGEWIGGAGLGDRFAVVVSTPALVLHLLGDAGDQQVPLDLPGRPVPGVAGDGAQVLVVTTDGTASAKGKPLAHGLVAGDAQRMHVELGPTSQSPSLFGDPDGFIIDQRVLLSSDGALDRAPTAQVPGARIYVRHDPGGDMLTLDGGRWLSVGTRVLSATRDTAGIELLLPDGADGQQMLHVVADLTPASAAIAVPRSPTVPGWIRAIRKDCALWEAVVGTDHVFASLERASLAPAGWFVRVAAPGSRTVAIGFDGRRLLLAWITSDGRYVYAQFDPA